MRELRGLVRVRLEAVLDEDLALAEESALPHAAGDADVGVLGLAGLIHMAAHYVSSRTHVEQQIVSLAMTSSPAAFLSYSRKDDDNGHVTQFRARLSDEIGTQTGHDFAIFQDRTDILWGQAWKERIVDSLNAVTFLIPILTPRFFVSTSCRDEVTLFVEREKRLTRKDLILPIYYVDAPTFNEGEDSQDDLIRLLAGRQYADWRELRFEPFTSPQVGKMLAQLALQVRRTLERSPAMPSARGTARTTPDDKSPARVGEEAEPKATGAPPARTEPPTRIVDAMHRGDHATIEEAVRAAKPGDRIVVRPGLYETGIVVDKPLEILGEGELGEVVVQARGADVLLFKATMGRVANLTLRQMGGGQWYGVDVAQGRLELEGCDITSQSLACVAIHAGADPRLRRNRIHDGKSAGILVYENGQGLLEDNEIVGNEMSGVAIKEGGNPTLRRNQINRNGYEAIWIYDAGAGLVEDNDLTDNVRGPWDVSADSKANLRAARNREQESPTP